MKDERYEVHGKIGQGGVGAVYRAFDKRLNREVAIKRVLPEGGFEDEGEAIEHLLKEATALSSVQHPHIVTVYDAGVDEDGPYVVMEILDGRTIDEMVERGTLVMEDFREVAVQSQEALIAAQDLDLVHRDLKPTNVMVVWLPSGKFQIKIVDFGLAKFSAKPTVQTIDHGDAVFGSIHFMAPEQFERTPLDKRTDMYAMGCLYYFTLTGHYPFSGDSAPQVMTAHLQHQVTPLHDLRPDLPAWVCDWVMWHINRKMDERPATAREALQKFLMNEQQNPTPPEDESPQPRPKFVFPGAEEGADDATPPAPAAPVVPNPPATASPASPPAHPASAASPPPSPTAPQPIQPPEGQAPSVHTTSQVTASQPPAPEPTPPPAPAPPAPAPSAPILTPATPPAGAPKLVTGTPPAPPAQPPAPAPPAQINLKQPGAPAAIPQATPAAPAPGVPQATPAAPAAPQSGAVITGSTVMSKPKGMSNAVKATIAAVLGVAVILVGWLVLDQMSSNKKAARATALLAPAKDLSARDVPTTGEDVDLLLGIGSSIARNSEREAVYQRLLIAKSSDGTDIDSKIAAFAASEENRMVSDIRIKLFQVLQGRKSPAAIPFLIEHAKTASEASTATAALTAIEKIATKKDLVDLVNILRFTRHNTVRVAAKRAIASVVQRTEGRDALADALINAYDSAPNDEVKRAYLELLGSAGGDEAAEIIRKGLEDEDKKIQLAAIAALRVWPDDTMFEDLIDYAKGQEDDILRANSFGGAYAFLKLERDRDELDLEDMWKMLAEEARTTTEKRQIIDGMAKLTDDWAFSVVEFFEGDDNDDVSFRAEKAREHMETRRKRIEGDEEDE
jgi:serine/threonine protein kinase